MKRIFIFFLLIQTKIVYAQREIVRTPIETGELSELQGIEADGYLVLKAAKTQDGTLTFFYIVTPKGQVLVSPAVKGSFEIIGSAYTPDELTVYFASSATSRDIHCLTLFKSDKRFSYHELNAEHSGFLCYLSFDSKFHLLRLNNKNKSLNLDSYSNNVKTDSLSLWISDARIFHRIKRSRNSFSKENHKPVFIPRGHEIPFDEATNQSKVYHHDNRLWLILDNIEAEKDLANTLVCELDFMGQKFNKTLLKLTAEPKVNHNSFLYNDTLFTLSISKDYMAIDLFQLKSLNRIGKVVYLKGQSLDFKKSFLVSNDFNQNIDETMAGPRGDLMVSNYVFRYMSVGIPVISVSAVGPNYLFLIGNYDSPFGKPSPATYTPGRSSPFGAVNTSAGSINPYAVPRKTYFYGFLAKKNLSTATKNFDTFGRLNQAENRVGFLGLNTTLNGECMINARDKVYLVYIDRGTTTLHVEEF